MTLLIVNPYFDNDWCVWADWKLIFRAHSDEAMSDMLAGMEARAELLSQMSDTYFYDGHLQLPSQHHQRCKAGRGQRRETPNACRHQHIYK